MTSRGVNLKPYRTALEGLITHLTPAKISALLGNAAANTDDPTLRGMLKLYISKLDVNGTYSREPIRLADMDYRYENVIEIIDYIEDILDSGDSSWEVIADMNGWSPSDT